MGFDTLPLKETYDSDEDDMLRDFYVPVLAQAVRYDRLAGYFSSAVLATAAEGMAEFIKNEGKMRLVTSVQLTRDDQQAILNGLASPEDAITRIIGGDLDLAYKLQRNHVKALAWMVAKKILEIKIAVPLAGDESFHIGSLSTGSIYHQKIGVLYDLDGNVVSFSGSVNETGKAWHENIEEFKVFCSWKPGQGAYGSKDARRFEKFWHGQSNSTKVFDLPAAIRERLIRDAPRTEAEAVASLEGQAPAPGLRGYQEEAVGKWLDAGMQGILEMATGTGKTRTAIECIRRVLDDPGKPALVVVACPYTHLVTQWVKELESCGLEVRTAHGSSASWRSDLSRDILRLDGGVIHSLVVVTTHDTLAGQKFMDMAGSCRSETMLVADEVHRLGAEKRSRSLLPSYRLRLGLSATPERYFDMDGTASIMEYFGGVVYEYGVSKAISDGHLSHYLLFPHIVYMTDDESKDYHEYSRKIAIEAAKEHPDPELQKILAIKRSKIIKSASNKMDTFREILEATGNLDHCLVYCTDIQMDAAAKVLHGMGIVFHRFTFRENKQERDKLLSEFASGRKDVLLAIKCLDEGVDVPSTQTAIILASSHSPIEFVQRRGRILRPYEGKEKATIHDMIVLPRTIPEGEIHTESEKAIIRKEIDRLAEFAGTADNPDHSRELVSKLMNRYDLTPRNGGSRDQPAHS